MKKSLTKCKFCGDRVVKPCLSRQQALKSCDPETFISEQVNHPHHYGGEHNPFEAIKVIDAWQLNFCLGNAAKYIARAGKKGDPIEDLRKARWYLDWEIQKLERS